MYVNTPMFISYTWKCVKTSSFIYSSINISQDSINLLFFCMNLLTFVFLLLRYGKNRCEQNQFTVYVLSLSTGIFPFRDFVFSEGEHEDEDEDEKLISSLICELWLMEKSPYTYISLFGIVFSFYWKTLTIPLWMWIRNTDNQKFKRTILNF